MGGANSTLTERLSQAVSNNISTNCSMGSSCQNIVTGPMNIFNGTTVACPDDSTLNLDSNQSKVSFSCSINQMIQTLVSAMQKSDNTSESNIGSFSNSDDNVSLTSTIRNTISAKCGANPADVTTNSGANSCNATTSQNIDHTSFFGGNNDHLGCGTVNLASNANSISMSCMMSVVNETTDKTSQAATNASKNDSILSGLFAGLFGPVVMILVVGVVLVIGVKMMGSSMGGKSGKSSTIISLAKDAAV